MNTLQISDRRTKWQDEHYIKQIPCPYAAGHNATIYPHGHRWSGQIDCDTCEINDMCEHSNTHTENIEVTAFYGDKDISYNSDIEVCDVCECAIEELA